MQYSLWLIKGIILSLFVACLLPQHADGRRYDKCETPDGRQGVCVVKRYCREATVLPLEACDNDDNFCCPIPTTQRSAKPSVFPVSEPHYERKDDIPKRDTSDSQANDHRSMTPDFERNNQKPIYGHSNSGDDFWSGQPADSHKVLSSSSEDSRQAVRPYHNPEGQHNTRTDSTPRSVPKASQDNNHRSVTSDSLSGNQRPVYDYINSGRDSPSNIPADSHKVLSSNGGSRQASTTQHNTGGEPYNTRNDNIPKRVPNTSQNSDQRSRTLDSHNGNQRPVFYHVDSGKDAFSNIPADSRKVLSSSGTDNQRVVTSHNSPEVQHDTRNGELPRSVPKVSQDSDRRSVTRDSPSEHKRPVHDRIQPGRESLSNKPLESHKVISSSSGDNRQPSTSRYNPEESLQPDIKENKKRTIAPEQSDNPFDTPVSGGRVRFEDPEHLFNDRYNKNRRLKPQSSNSNIRTSVENSEIDTNNKQNSAGPDSAKNNRNLNPKPQSSAVEHYPSRHQLEVQKLPSNPRRLKPLHNDGRNDTIDEVVRHTFYPNSQPKVPACGVKPYDLFIAGGETSEPYEWPWMTSIFRRHQGSRPKTFLCGGSLISTKYVLTAAHCFVNNYVVLPASSFIIRLGSHFLDSGEEYTVSDLVIHHNHSGSDFFNDIALVKIASEVYITDKIAPICLPTPDMMSNDFVDRIATVAGWGDTAFRTGGSRALQHVAIPIVSGEECFAAYSRVRGAAFLARGSDHVICAGLREGGKDACLGDSGGPLMLKTVDDRWIIIGIVSLGYKCAEPGYPGVYTRVTHYLSWIHANMKPH